MMKKIFSGLFLFLCFLVFTLQMSLADNLSMIHVAQYSKSDIGGLPAGWQPLTFQNIESHSCYEVIDTGDRVVLRAQARASASGLIRYINIDPEQHPVLNWEWRVDHIYKRGDVRHKKGDDYPARIYVNFAFDEKNASFFDKMTYSLVKQKYGEKAPFTAINYIWANKAPKETMVPNPYTSQTMMIPVVSGKKNLGQWRLEKRNIFKDYERAFGVAPVGITSIAVMSDSDNTGEAATAYYGDIWFSRK